MAGDSVGSVVTWNGSSWAEPQAIDPGSSSSGGSMLTGMSCVGPTFCVATDSGGRVLVYHGRAWSKSTRVTSGAALNAASCATPTFCLAVGAAGHAYTYR